MLEDHKGGRFKDVAMDHWANGYIQSMADHGLVEGYGDDTFKPEANISRGEMATILARIIEKKELGVINEGTMPWLDTYGHWARDSVAIIYTRGIIIDEQDLVFKPDQKLTRAEAVVMINQLIKKKVLVNEHHVPFIDVNSSHWAYQHIVSASSMD